MIQDTCQKEKKRKHQDEIIGMNTYLVASGVFVAGLRAFFEPPMID